MRSRRLLVGMGALAIFVMSLTSSAALAQGFPYMTDFLLRGVCQGPSATLSSSNPMPVGFYPFADYTEVFAARKNDPSGSTLSSCGSFTKAWITPGRVGLTLTDNSQPAVILSPYVDAKGAPGLVLDMLLETRVDDASMSNFRKNYTKVVNFFYPIANAGQFSFGFENYEGNGKLIWESSSDVLLTQGIPYNIRVALTSAGLNAYRCSLELFDRLSPSKAEDKNLNVVNILSGNLRLTYDAVNYLKFMSTGEFETHPYTIKEIPILTQSGVKNSSGEKAAIEKLSMYIRSTVRSLVPTCIKALNDDPEYQLPSYKELEKALLEQ